MSEESKVNILKGIEDEIKTVDNKLDSQNEEIQKEIKSINSKVDLKLSSMDNEEKPKEVTMKISEIIDHMGSCSDGSCGIHQSIKKSTDKSYMKGFVLGAKFGKQKRN
tara:strand:- start:1991 stop:2314 length:324 start_codon:yes stop_codon:yes gene_type:complete